MTDRWKSDYLQSVEECRRHVGCLERSLTLLTFFPLDINSYHQLTEEQIEHIDQMIYRFMKLQDSMGRKLFPSLFQILEPEKTDIPFLDKLSHLEKISVIDSADDWLEYRVLRNNLAHEYPDREEEMITNLNLLVERLPSFLTIYSGSVQFARDRSLL
ncbi:MAG: hypothetical protein PQJ58_17895 [Spirochaetales bacterium]|nr:hypothetical protein [Spirochaetales bacterium]